MISAQRSVEVILAGQSPSGGYVACPSFENYRFCWFRDGCFIADAMREAGEMESCDRFLDWCARIDGASEIRIFVKLILPLGLPAIASLAIFQFLWTWNDLLVALVMARNTQPITVDIFSQLRQFGSNIDIIAPASFLSMIIPLGVFFSFQRYFAQGLLAGSVK